VLWKLENILEQEALDEQEVKGDEEMLR